MIPDTETFRPPIDGEALELFFCKASILRNPHGLPQQMIQGAVEYFSQDLLAHTILSDLGIDDQQLLGCDSGLYEVIRNTLLM